VLIHPPRPTSSGARTRTCRTELTHSSCHRFARCSLWSPASLPARYVDCVLGPALLTGADVLPPGTLCLTYDDGPGATPGDERGPKTLRLAQYLAGEGVSAAFFMSGVHVAELPDAPDAVRALGHVVGNHTWHHWHLPEVLDSGGDLVGELTSTDAVLQLPLGAPVYVRPPYGHWSAAVAAALTAATAANDDWVGPVGWDVDTEDWTMWQRRATAPRTCRT
jgi:peptidoglycan/xylan/chitin deacetylase (PgdA/CDA1 family)